jgi:NADH-quinone oxidoreductase subunit L
MGGLAKSMPLTCFAYGVSTLAIAGIPPFSGYYSKHGILDAIPLTYNAYLQPWLGVIGLIATGITVLTALYMFRSFIMTFMGEYRGHEHPHEAPMVMTAPVLVLAVMAVVGGAFLSPVFLPYLTGPLPKMGHHAATHPGMLGYVLGSLPALAGIGLAFWLFLISPTAKEFLRKVFLPLEKLSEGKFFVDEVYEISVVAPLQSVSSVSSKTIDQSLFLGGGEAIGKISRALGELTARVTTGQVGTYVLLMFCAAAFFVYFFLPVR